MRRMQAILAKDSAEAALTSQSLRSLLNWIGQAKALSTIWHPDSTLVFAFIERICSILLLILGLKTGPRIFGFPSIASASCFLSQTLNADTT